MATAGLTVRIYLDGNIPRRPLTRLATSLHRSNSNALSALGSISAILFSAQQYMLNRLTSAIISAVDTVTKLSQLFPGLVFNSPTSSQALVMADITSS